MTRERIDDDIRVVYPMPPHQHQPAESVDHTAGTLTRCVCGKWIILRWNPAYAYGGSWQWEPCSERKARRLIRKGIVVVRDVAEGDTGV